MSVLTMIQQALAGEHPEGLSLMLPPPVAELIGFEAVRVDRGSAVFRLEARRDKHANPMGTLHGGILCDLADAAMGMSCASLLEQGESFTTVELKINYFRPVLDGQLEARAKAVNAGKTVVYLECEVVTLPEEKLVAKATSTCLVLRGEQAKGR
ncbi:MAG: PaaI family thioesterase [Minicystis sp.]